ncbi:MAG: hypothetical protein JNL82_32640 [Myxococcales bacterium]|nr:hypothetical protein [Myxococcales bacterium]
MRVLAVLLCVAGCAARSPDPAPPSPTAAPGGPADPVMTAEIQRIEAMLVEEPDNTPYMYVLATYYDRVRDGDRAVMTLERLARKGWDLGVGPDFPNTGDTPAFRAVAARLDARVTPVHRASEAFRFPRRRDVRSEGCAYDPVDDRFYYSGGAGTLLRVDREGAIEEVAVDPVGRKFGRLGMDVDAGRRQLWAVSAAFDPSADPDEQGRSGVSVYDLRDGRLLRRVMAGSAAEPWLLNDMTLLADGTAYVSDTGRDAVVRLAPGADRFETFAAGLSSPNGVVVSADERTLYVADFRGLNAIDLATGARELLRAATLLHGIDGLLEHRGALVGIQNVIGGPRVVRVHTRDGNRVEVLESQNALLDTPATGVVAGDEYFFMANLAQKDVDRVVLRIAL